MLGGGGANSAGEMDALADEIIGWMLPGSVPPAAQTQPEPEVVAAAGVGAMGGGFGAGVADAVTPTIVPPTTAAA